jgi:hypothetical protein
MTRSNVPEKAFPLKHRTHADYNVISCTYNLTLT